MPGKGWSFTGKIHQKVCDKAQLSGGRSTRSGLIHQSAAGVHTRDRSRERDLRRAGLVHVRKNPEVVAKGDTAYARGVRRELVTSLWFVAFGAGHSLLPYVRTL